MNTMKTSRRRVSHMAVGLITAFTLTLLLPTLVTAGVLATENLPVGTRTNDTNVVFSVITGTTSSYILSTNSTRYTVLAQTFKVPADVVLSKVTLESVYIHYRSTATNGNFRLRLVDMGTSYPHTYSTNVFGVNLLADPSFTLKSTTGGTTSESEMKLTLTGGDRIKLTPAQVYRFELVMISSNASSLQWFRNTSATTGYSPSSFCASGIEADRIGTGGRSFSVSIALGLAPIRGTLISVF